MARNETYQQFVDKFKTKLTTYDCYTPDAVYDAVASFVSEEYGIERDKFVRPFWPGGDYESYDYPDGCVVVDNPPFSVLSKILRFYASRNIKFFLFALSLTLFSLRVTGNFAFFPASVTITYANGAKISSAFVSNLEPGCIRVSSRLNRMLREAESKQKQTRDLPKYRYDKHVISSATIKKISDRDIDLYVSSDDCFFVRRLDAQKDYGKSIYGGGYLLSDAAADYIDSKRIEAEQKRIEEGKSIEWPISER